MIKQRVIGGTVLFLLALILVPYALHHSHQPAMVHSSPMLQSDSLAKRDRPHIIMQSDTPIAVAEMTSQVTSQATQKIKSLIQQKVTVPTKRTLSLKQLGHHKPKAWVIQLASFSSQENAQALVKSLQAQGYTAYASQTSGSHQITKVMVGPELDKTKARDILANLEKTAHLKGLLLPFQPLKL